MKKTFAIALAATTLLSLEVAGQNTAQDAKAVIDAAAAALGTAGLQSIQYSGTGPTNPTALPAPSPFTTNLVDNAARLKLDVALVVHVHGGINSYSDVLKAAGR